MIANASRQHRMPVAVNDFPALNASVVREDWAQVLDLCKRILPAAKNKADLYSLMGRALVHKGDDSAAIAAYLKGINLQLEQPKSHYALGVLYSRQQKHMQAICHYQWALRLRPDWSKAAFHLGQVFYRIGFYEQALKTYQSILKRDPSCADAYLALGRLYEHKGDFHRAAKQYRQAVFLPENADSDGVGDRVMAYRYLGSALVQLKQPAAAASAYREALLLRPDDASLHSQLGQSLIAQDHGAQSLTVYQQALTLDSSSISAHHSLGRLWRNHQNLNKAIGHFQQAIQQAIQQDVNGSSILSDCARTLSAQGRWRELFDCFRLAIAHQPNFVSAYCQRTVQLPNEDLLFRLQRICGRFLMGLRYADADMAYDILCERLAQLYRCLGDLSTACDAPVQAISSYQLALTLKPKNIETYSRLADCLISQRRLAAGIAIAQAGLLQAVEAPPQLQLQATLQSAIAQYAARKPSPNCSEIKGIYRNTQDWLSHQESAQITTAEVTPPDPQCGGVTCQSCMSGLIRRFSPTQIGQRTFRCNPAPAADDLSFSTFAATIPNGRAWIAPKQNDWAVCHEIAVFTPDNFLLADLSRSYPWHLPGCQNHDAINHSIFQRDKPLPPPQQLPGKVAILSGLSGHIYYHWLFDVLPRLEILRENLEQQGLDLSNIDYFVVNNFEKSYQIETLAALGIPAKKVVESDRIPHIQADELVVPSFAGHFDWVPPSSIDFLRRTFLPSTPPTADLKRTPPPREHPKPRRLYISRAQAKYRHIFNEPAVIELLSQFDFTSVNLETMTVADQVQLFAQAEIVVAPHGSGLTNLAFCSPSTAVIECFSPHYLRTDYWMISQYLQLNHHYLIGESFACDPLRQLMYPSGLTEDFSVDISALRSLLMQITKQITRQITRQITSAPI
ncbi:MAG: tetratricopeptide repeat protein [Phormidesmis sp.]